MNASCPPPLVVESAVKCFRQGSTTIRALAGANLSVAAGEFVAIMGASGSGKSTLLHAIAGLTDLDGGRILVGGQDLAAMSDARLTRFRRRHVGLVFQAFNLIPALSAADNVRLPAEGGAEADERAVALLERLGMGARAAHKPDALSGGEQQRVAIARALVTDPAILLADEPTGSLDSATGQDICRLLRTLCDEQRRTLVVVTHEPAVAMWADRVVVLRDGVDVAGFPVPTGHDPEAVAAGYQHAALAAPEKQP